MAQRFRRFAWVPAMAIAMGAPASGAATSDRMEWIAATDTTRIVRHGVWTATAHRFGARGFVETGENGSAIELVFRGSGVVLRLAEQTVPSYGSPMGGDVVATMDGRSQIVHPLSSAREVVIGRDLRRGEHRVQISHRARGERSRVGIEGFRILDGPSGDLGFTVIGERNAFLVDVRATLTRNGAVVRDEIERNWLTGACRLAGLPPGDGYALAVRAAGWKPVAIDGIRIEPGSETTLPPVLLARTADAENVWFPALGRQAIRRPGETFRSRLEVYSANVESIRLVRAVGPATISRVVPFAEDTAAAFYYDREFAVTVPADTPPGLYDLVATVRRERGTGEIRSVRSVQVVAEYPRDPLFVSWGHLDTWGQNQAEYVERLAGIANLLAPDMVLVADEVNAAYVAGALAALDVPYVVNFGNHQVPGQDTWFGDPIGCIDIGPGVAVLNVSQPWFMDFAKADALLAARADVPVKVINAFEHNAPVATFLDRHGVRMIHDGHGPERKYMSIGATPTIRIGKINSESFRVIRFRDGRVVSATYSGDRVAPIPFPRGAETPLRAAFSPANDGTHAAVTGTLVNDLAEPYPACRLTFVMPAGEHDVTGGRLEATARSDDGGYDVVTVRVDAPAESSVAVTVHTR